MIRMEDHNTMKSLYSRLREIANDLEVPILTATQLTRDVTKSEEDVIFDMIGETPEFVCPKSINLDYLDII